MFDLERLLPPRLIPGCLWDHKKGVLTLPDALAKAYVEHTDRNGLRDLGLSREDGKGATGGPGRDQQLNYFARKFDGACARAMLAILDPKDALGKTSNRILVAISGSAVQMTDAPCGPGSATLGMLCTVGVLRAKGVLPRLPLYVNWTGGELSADAIDICKHMFAELSTELERQAIFLNSQWVSWDVTDSMSTTDLVRAGLSGAAASQPRFLLVANFSDALQREGKRKEAFKQLEEIFRYVSGANSTAVWIEPDMNMTTEKGGLFAWLRSSFASLWKRVSGPDPQTSPEEPAHRCEAEFVLPLRPELSNRVRIAVLPISLVRQE